MKNLNRIFQASAAALLLLATPSAVHATPLDPPDAVTFEAVDSAEFTGPAGLIVKGLSSGQTTPQEYQFFFHEASTAAECHKQALLAMERPGRYSLLLEYNNDSYGYACKLTRR